MNLSSYTLIGVGPSRFARGMAGCICEKEDDFYEEIESYTAKKIIVTSQVNEDFARGMARSITSERRKVDDRYKEKDRQGTEGEGPVFEFTQDGDVYFPEFNGNLNTMYEDQKAVFPEEFRPEEYDTVMSAYQSLKNGATQAAHIVHQYDRNGTLDIRDVVVLTYDHETNSGRMHILNISREGENHRTTESARYAMKDRLGGFTEEKKADDVFLFVRDEKPIDPVLFFREKKNLPIFSEHTVMFLKKEGFEAQEKLAPDPSGQEAMPVVRFVMHADAHTSDAPFRLPVFLQRLMGKDENGDVTQGRRVKNPEFRNNSISAHDKESIRHSKEKMPSKTEAFFFQAENHGVQMEEFRKSIEFSGKSGSAVGGALFMVDLLSKSVQKPLENEKREIRKTKRLKEQGVSPVVSMRKESVKSEYEHLSLIFRFEPVPAKIAKKKEVKKSVFQERKRKKHKETKRIKKKEKVLVLFSRQEKKNKGVLKEQWKKEQVRLRPKESVLLSLLHTITKKIHHEKHLSKEYPEKKIAHGTKERKNYHERKKAFRGFVLEFVRALIFFTLLQSSFEKQSQENKKSAGFRILPRKEEELPHTSSPWVLLAIIWYMTMIREQGKVIIPPKKKKKKKTIPHPAFFKRGIIYAYQSMSRGRFS